MEQSIRSFISITLLSTLLLWSCGTSTKEENNSKEFQDAEESLKDRIADVAHNMPSPSVIPYMLEATGADFNQSLLNNIKKADQYKSRSEKAAYNLGVYATDIGYLVSYEKTQEAINYMTGSKALADDLGVIGTFDRDLLVKFETNIGNRDSLASLLNATIKKTDDYLRDDNRNKLASMMIAGSFIEGLYISVGIVKTYPKNLLPNDSRFVVLTPLIQVIFEQEKSVDELITMLNAIEDKESISGMINDLGTLKQAFVKLDMGAKIKNNQSDLVFGDDSLKEITEVVTRIRMSIVE